MSTLDEYKVIADAAARLRTELADAIASSPNDAVRALSEDLPSTDTDTPITVTLVGAYNAGKSTLIRALTGRDDIQTGSNVTTQEAAGYAWRGLHLIDTPGVNARRPDHDAATQRAIDRADLLAFVVSDELFSDVLGPYFRSLAIDQGRGREMMLVVNKMAQTGGRPEDKAADIEPVTHPFTVADLRTVFTDAESALKARETDRPDRAAALLRRSNFEMLEARLAEFAAEQGWLGRLTTPLVTVRRVAEDARAVVSADLPEEQMALQLLRLQRRILRASQSRLERTLNGLLDEAKADLATLGDRLAETLQMDASEEAVNRQSEATERAAKQRCEKLAEDADAAVQAELQRLDKEIQELKNTSYATRLLEAGREISDDELVVAVQPSGDVKIKKVSPHIARIRKASEVANKLGGMAFKFAAGPNAATMQWTTKAASGSQAHKTVLAVGKFFGHKFKPWGAVKVAKHIGTAGRVLGAVGGVLAVVAQIAEDRQIEEAERRLRASRDDIRTGYRDIGTEVERAFRQSVEELNATVYAPALERLDEQTAEITQSTEHRGAEAETFAAIASATNDLIQRTHAQLPSLVPHD